MNDIEDLKWEIIRLKRENEELKTEVAKQRYKYDSAKFTIEQELEPRIEREKRSYDAWVTNPGRRVMLNTCEKDIDWIKRMFREYMKLEDRFLESED